jgi:putative ABC transport system permease protein
MRTKHRLLASIARGILSIAPRSFSSAWSDEIVSTMSKRCEDIRQRRGRMAWIRTALAELGSLFIVVLRTRFGGRPGARSGQTSAGGRPSMLFVDFRHALRRVRGSMGTSALAVGMLALAVGTCTSMFVVVDALMLRPAPFLRPDELAHVWMRNASGGRRAVESAVLQAWRASTVLQDAQGLTTSTVVIGGDRPVSRQAAAVSPGMFAMLGARPMLGRTFGADDGKSGARDRVVIAETLWRQVFGGDSRIIGRRINIDGASPVVIGVMSGEFRFPQWNTEVWTAFDFEAQDTAPAVSPRAYVRLRAEVPEADAFRVLTEIAHLEDPRTAKNWAQRVSVVGQPAPPQARQAVLALGGGVVLVFLVLCLNVASLLLARFTARRREFGMCAALGGTRLRLLREAALEGVILGGVASIVGVGLAWGLVSVARALLPESMAAESLNPIDLDLRAMAFAVAAGFMAVLTATMLPAWIGTARTSAVGLQAGTARGGTEPRSARFLSRAFLSIQVALACALLVGATILVRSFVNLSHIDRGFETDGITIVEVWYDGADAKDKAGRTALSARVHDVLRALPGVTRAVGATASPLTASGVYWEIPIETAPGTTTMASFEDRAVDAQYFELYRIPIVRGRSFRNDDPENAIIVGEQLASALWPASEVVGATVHMLKNTYQVVGVAKETGRALLDTRQLSPDLYFKLAPGRAYETVGVQCGAQCPPEGLIRQRLLEVGAGVTVSEVRDLADAYGYDLAQPRATATLGAVFAGTALLASAGGLFSVLSFAVSRRRREFGIRMALGSSTSAIGGVIFRDGLQVSAIGLATGGLLGVVLARALASLEYGVAASDSVNWFTVVGLLTVTTLAACWWPARDAMRTDPQALLREE